MKYSQDVLNRLEKVRRANPNISQRRLARNIRTQTRFDRTDSKMFPPTTVAGRTLLNKLGYPTEVAIQHLVRQIDLRIDRANTLALDSARDNAPVGV